MNAYYPFENTPLPYGYDALEPYISAQTMEVHYTRFFQSYINNLNSFLSDKPRLQNMTLEQLIMFANRLPRQSGIPLSRYSGGVYNHRLYFDGLSPDFEQKPSGDLMRAITSYFSGYDGFVKQFSSAAMSVFGSGYAWLVSDGRGRLRILTAPNQNTPLPEGWCPILNLDVWEHAYYPDHYNLRGDYVEDWFNVANWNEADKRYLICRNQGVR